MSKLLRFKRDDSRWKLLFLMGIVLIAITYLPSIVPKHAEGSSKITNDELTGDRSSPAMTTQQIEQVRSTLIHKGFSPMQADTILPTNPQP